MTERDLVKESIERDLACALRAVSFSSVSILQLKWSTRLRDPASWLSMALSKELYYTTMRRSLSGKCFLRRCRIDHFMETIQEIQCQKWHLGRGRRRGSLLRRSLHKGHILRPSRFQRFFRPILVGCYDLRARPTQSRWDQRRSFAVQDLGSICACNQR